MRTCSSPSVAGMGSAQGPARIRQERVGPCPRTQGGSCEDPLVQPAPKEQAAYWGTPIERLVPPRGTITKSASEPAGVDDPAHHRRPPTRTRRLAHPRPTMASQRRPLVNPHHLPQPRLGPHPEHPHHRAGNQPPHTPLRPIWTCRACGHPWPCAEARLLLKAQYDTRQSSLSIYLAGLCYEAMHDLYHLNPHGGPSPRELFDRFVAWGPFRRPAGTAPGEARGARPRAPIVGQPSTTSCRYARTRAPSTRTTSTRLPSSARRCTAWIGLPACSAIRSWSARSGRKTQFRFTGLFDTCTPGLARLFDRRV